MTSNYFKELDEVSKARYLQKLTFDGTSLPDPLDEAIRPYTFLRDVKLWPLVQFGDVYNYLVQGECVYTNEKFKSFKALDCYNYFNSGKVKNILTYKNKNLDICIVTCDVQASQTLKIHHRPWIVTATNGMVHSGHCTCMAG